MVEFTPPEFMEDNDIDSIMERMQAALPPDIASTPGSMAYNFLQPAAIEKSELLERHLTETLMLMFPMWAYGEWLDEHAKIAGTSRKQGESAKGELTVTGPPGTVVEAGTIFTTVGTDDVEEKEYKSEEQYTIDETGVIYIPVVATEPGEEYNAGAGTVILMDEPLDGVSVVNEKEITGGINEEDDESLRSRIQDIHENLEISYAGSAADYRRWARECNGVEECMVQETKDRPGVVRLIIMGKDGKPIPETVDVVKNYIERPDSPELSLLPIGGVTLEVETVSEMILNYQAEIIIGKGYNIDEIMDIFRVKIREYHKEAKKEGIIRYNKVSAILSMIEGVNDFNSLQFNIENDDQITDENESLLIKNASLNIPIAGNYYPAVGEIRFTGQEG